MRALIVASLVLAAPAQAQAPASARAPGTDLTLDDAVQRALENSPNLARGRAAVDRARGARLVTEGRFDWVLDSAVALSDLHTPAFAQRDATLVAQVAVFKRFGWGMEVTPSVQLQAVDTERPDLPADAEARNVAVLNVRVTQPILRGAGRAAVTERDASRELERAAASDFQQFVSERVLIVAQAYWRYQAATQAVVILKEAEARAQQLLQQTQQLVAGDQAPKADLGQVQASLADRARDRIVAEQAVVEARTVLGLEMGIPADQIGALGPPATPFPALTEAAPGASLAEAALRSRHDVASADARMSAAQLFLDGALDTELPDLSLSLDVGYSGVVVGSDVGSFFGPVAQNIPGANLGLTLALRWPIASSEAAGQVLIARAQVDDARTDKDELARRIRASLDVALASARASAEAVRRSTEASGYHRTAVANEEAKKRSGLATLFDVILTGDRLTGSTLAQLSDQERWANAVARLSFEAGALSQTTEQGATVVLDALIAPPALPGAPGR